MSEQIDWDAFGPGIKFVSGVPKIITFAGATMSTKDFTDIDSGKTKTSAAIEWTVTKEDGESITKRVKVTSKRLNNALRPFAKKGFPFTARVTQFGASFDTKYTVEAI